MSLNDPNRASLQLAAEKLGPLRDEVVFVGGSVAGLLITDPNAPEVRPTKDVDVVIDRPVTLLTYVSDIGARLRQQGFHEDADANVACRWVMDGLRVDVMSASVETHGFTNHWYQHTLETAQRHHLAGVTIRVVSPPCFIATKIEAFRDRGASDYLSSHDFEDILLVLGGRQELVNEVKAAKEDLRGCITAFFRDLLEDKWFNVDAHALGGRARILEKRIQELAGCA